jgi:hypothetical protein
VARDVAHQGISTPRGIPRLLRPGRWPGTPSRGASHARRILGPWLALRLFDGPCVLGCRGRDAAHVLGRGLRQGRDRDSRGGRSRRGAVAGAPRGPLASALPRHERQGAAPRDHVPADERPRLGAFLGGSGDAVVAQRPPGPAAGDRRSRVGEGLPPSGTSPCRAGRPASVPWACSVARAPASQGARRFCAIGGGAATDAPDCFAACGRQASLLQLEPCC